MITSMIGTPVILKHLFICQTGEGSDLDLASRSLKRTMASGFGVDRNSLSIWGCFQVTLGAKNVGFIRIETQQDDKECSPNDLDVDTI